MRRLLPFLALLMLLATPRAEAFSPPLRAQAEAAIACQMAVGFDSAECLTAFATSPELREALACALRGREVAGCLGLEVGLFGACLLAGGGSLEAAAGCVALRVAMAAAASCVEAGFGGPEGCLAPAGQAWARARALVEAESRLDRWRARAAGLWPGR